MIPIEGIYTITQANPIYMHYTCTVHVPGSNTISDENIFLHF